ncbi:S-layer protein [Methanocaldococcus villosus KIN24-T80]|uniref:S-layer protein n=1 Tax=Methanocaldococcus villosus KIN24-T80 TaxID=1069083 RepID=N6VS58_9EURY|nr:S-layer protein [Methanocaldococcus villosus]ENN95986.1 S-layer protein [Methanocaldococcus villosus KIN24-T80]
MKKVLLIFLILTSVFAMEPIIVANKSTVDYNNSLILMDNYYSSKKIIIENDTVKMISRNILYLPFKNSLDIRLKNDILRVKIERNNDDIIFKDIYYIIKLDKEIEINGEKYNVKNFGNFILLLGDGENVTTKGSFEFNNYRINIKLVSMDHKSLIVDIYKDGVAVEKNVKLNMGEMYYSKGIAVKYKNYSKNLFEFTVYKAIKIEKGKDYPLDKRFTVEDINNYIKLKFKNSFKNRLNLSNCYIYPINKTLFKAIVEYIDSYKKENISFENGFYIMGNKVYYKGKEVRSGEKFYFGSVDIINNDIFNMDRDVILVGGERVNSYVRELVRRGLLKDRITETNPGRFKGYIIKIRNKNHFIYVLAGSDRWGTKAAIEAFLNRYHGEDKLLVNWKKE